MTRRAAWVAWFTGAVALTPLGVSADFPVAGTQPHARPVGAPTITEVRRDKAWHARALTGISQPVPPSLRWLDDQGNWYTPFTRPGMPPPYDIRGWHSVPAPR
jgi:hypothetical protein